MTQLLDTKSILAKLMATENLIVEQRKVQTASFDVVSRVLTIPTLDDKISKHTYDLFVGHEVGHALFTSEQNLMDSKELKIPKSVINVVEDSRIERKIKFKYPGLRISFVKAYVELFDQNFFNTRGKNLNNYNFIDRINLHCKVGASLNINFSESESEILKEVESTETFNDVIEVSKKIVDLMKQQLNEDKQKQLEEEMEENSFSSEFDREDSDEESQQHMQEESEENEEFDSDEYDDMLDEQDGDCELNSKTDESFHRNESKLFSSDLRNYVYVNIPDIKSSKVIVDYKEVYTKHKNFASSDIKNTFPSWIKDTGVFDNACLNTEKYQKIRLESNKVVSYLVKEFELRKNADQLKRASVAKTGELNMQKLYAHTFSEDIFKKITVLPGGKSHGLVIFIDWSGSMHHHMENTIKQLINIVLFCKKVNIPFEVYAFQSSESGDVVDSYNENDLHINSFRLMNLFSSRMSAAEFKYAASALVWFCDSLNARVDNYFTEWYMHSTPLNHTAIAAMNIIPEFQKKYKLQVVNTIFLTDGESDNISSCYKKSSYPNSHAKNGLIPTSFKYNYNSMIVFRDPKTKFQEIVHWVECDGIKQTEVFMKLLKHKTKCNIIGFYLLSKRELSKVKIKYMNEKDLENSKSFAKNKYCVMTNAGFDEYYLMLSDKGENEDDGFTVKQNATAKGIANAFAKYAGNKMANRVMLNRFIGLIV
jgi:hypothetical protein